MWLWMYTAAGEKIAGLGGGQSFKIELLIDWKWGSAPNPGYFLFPQKKVPKESGPSTDL